MITDDELNKRVHEIMGLCWHVRREDIPYRCVLCNRFLQVGIDTNETCHVFTRDWSAFGLMFEFMQKHDRWEEFRDRCGIVRDIGSWYIYEGIISPRPFAEAMCKFFEEDK